MIIFYYGSDSLRLRQQAHAMCERYRAKYASGINLLTFDMATTPIHDIRDAVRSVSFFDEVRLCILTNVFAHTAQEVHSLITTYLLVSERDTVLMILEPTDAPHLVKQDAELFSTLIGSRTTHQEFEPLSGTTLLRWITQEAARQEGSIAPDAARALSDRFGGDTWGLTQEIAKLVNYTGGAITRAAIEVLSSRILEDNVFALTDALARNDWRSAVAVLYRQLAAGNDPFAILGAITYQLRNLIAAQGDGTRAPLATTLARTLGIHPFAARKTLGYARSITPTNLRTHYHRLATLDVTAKRGLTHIEDELFRFVLSQ